ncbi:glycerol-3-phosphate dehydrogenase/oxidase [Paenibacillus antri]|uniref:Glycerol-3-phosphate dehydrogenase n=1 Tax=Paenibacillus antri TaxID=2582848 RepID=A0A5R9G5A3_9BACL|nr:FAD-dependent oxidoreductase [Paenibacillus antri]TLS50961.1 glycerol-3-phosphate dehydrogenase/oxidase [Paenibacillus antri]
MEKREAVWAALREGEFDLLVVGGGITGAGIALDAATRGMKVALVEMQDYAAGTSSRSTKLVHGGLRYLKQFEVRMVAEVGKERAVVYENGPHVTTPEWMLLPMYRGGSLGPLATSFGLRLYDWLAGVRRSERRSMLSASEALSREPLLKGDGLLGGGYYVEYRTDDARLTIETLKRAADAGAACMNYAKAEKLLYGADGKVCGAQVVDLRTGASAAVSARVVVNATGPWVDALRELDGSKRGKTVRLTKGVHLVFDGGRFPLRQAVYFDTPDGRMAFAIPRDGKTYLGTTDTDYRGDPAHPAMSAADRAYLLGVANFLFPTLGLTEADIESSWAGLRPLVYQEGKAPSEVSRRDEIFESPSGLVTIAGGKLTGYRKMAEGIVDRVAARLSAAGAGPFGPCVTRTLPLSGGDVGGSAGWAAYAAARTAEGEALGLPRDAASRIARRYGSNAPDVLRRAAGDAARASAERAGLPLDVYATLVYAIEREQALTPADYWVRRTGDLFFDIARVRAFGEASLAFMARRLDYAPEEKQRAREELARLLREATTPVEEAR